MKTKQLSLISILLISCIQFSFSQEKTLDSTYYDFSEIKMKKKFSNINSNIELTASDNQYLESYFKQKIEALNIKTKEAAEFENTSEVQIKEKIKKVKLSACNELPPNVVKYIINHQETYSKLVEFDIQ